MAIFLYGETELEYLKKKDKKLAEAIERIGMIEREVIPDLFTALINIIIGQQISNKAKVTVWNRFLGSFPEITPQSIVAARDEEIQQCGISMRKVNYIKAIADAVIQGKLELEILPNLPDDEVIKQLSALKGLGVWSAEMLLIFSLQRPNILSRNDLAIRRGMTILYGHQELDRAKFEKYKRRYSPYGSIASLYIWEIAQGK